MILSKTVSDSKVKSNRKHSKSFAIAIVLIIFMPFYYYFALLTHGIEASWPGNIIVSITLLIDIWMLYRICSVKKPLNGALGLFIAFFVSAIISYLVTLSGIHRILMFAMLLLGVLLFLRDPLHHNETKFLFWLFVAAVACILFRTAIGTEDAIASNKVNPNSGGFLLAMVFCLAWSMMFRERKVLFVIIGILCVGLQLVYNSRTALFGLLLFGFIDIVLRIRKKRFSFNSVFCIMIVLAIMGILIAVVYSQILYPLMGYGQVKIFGKDIFTGRQTIWDFTLKSIREHFWFGVGSRLNEQQFHEGYYELIMNAHNQPLGTLAACGIFVFVTFYFALAHILAQPYKKNSPNKYNRLPVVFFMVIMMMSYFDIYFMSLYNLLPILIAFSILAGTGNNTMIKREIKS